MASIIEKNLDFNIYIEPETPTRLFGDAFRLRQVLSNIIGNAVKYTEQGSVTVNINKIHEIDHTKVLLEFSIEDTGIGIDGGMKDKLFNSFSQMDDSNTRIYGGTGLGLAISKSLVEMMGGTIWIESILDTGSCFYFTYEATVSASSSTNYKNQPSGIEKQLDIQTKILVVEDDVVSQMVAVKFLESVFSNIIIAKNGKEAVELWKNDHFDIVLMDVQMPVLDGIEATKLIRSYENSLDRHTPILAMTALSNINDMKKCKVAGMDEVIKKPIRKEELLQQIQYWLLQKTQ